MNTLKILILTLVVLLLGACSTGTGPGIGSFLGSRTPVGTYAYDVTPQSVSVDVRSFRGGPEVEVRTDADGTRTVTVTPSNQEILGEVLQLLNR